MIDCSLHGAMMSKHKVPTSFRPPSLRPQVYIYIYTHDFLYIHCAQTHVSGVCVCVPTRGQFLYCYSES